MIDFHLDPKSGVPFYRQIIDQIRYGISSGNLQVGEQLPTVRALAVQLKVNLNTVSKAYKELEIQKILESHQGTGTFIGSVKVELPAKEKKQKIKHICTDLMNIASNYGFSFDDVISELTRLKGEKK